MTTINIRLDENLVRKATMAAKSSNRTTFQQIEHWIKIGKMMEDNPELSYEFVQQAITAKAEKKAGNLDNYQFT